jgi:hypothetical protein
LANPGAFGMAHAFISRVEGTKGDNDMKTEQFQNLSLKQTREILDTVTQLMNAAEKLFCMVRGALDKFPADLEDILTN